MQRRLQSLILCESGNVGLQHKENENYCWVENYKKKSFFQKQKLWKVKIKLCIKLYGKSKSLKAAPHEI